jgi:hypothetical protein
MLAGFLSQAATTAMKVISALVDAGMAPVLMDTILHLAQALLSWRTEATRRWTVEARLAAGSLISWEIYLLKSILLLSIASSVCGLGGKEVLSSIVSAG